MKFKCEICVKIATSTLERADVSFSSPILSGHAQQVQLLCLLVYTAAKEGAQQFVEMIFSCSAGRIVFDAYKSNSQLPEVIAREHGNLTTARYFENITEMLPERR